MTTPHCPMCKGTDLNWQARHDIAQRIGSTPIRIRLPCVACRSCGERVVDGDVISRGELEVARVLAKRNVLSPESFRFVRMAIGLQSKQLAMILSVQPETVSRWEHGQRDVDPTAWSLLRMLVEDHASGRRSIDDVLREERDLPKPGASAEEIFVEGPERAA